VTPQAAPVTAARQVLVQFGLGLVQFIQCRAAEVELAIWCPVCRHLQLSIFTVVRPKADQYVV
jgi:hypothetical protein